MELGGKHVFLPNRRGEALAVGRARRHDRGVNWFGKKAVHEINVAAAGNAAQNRTIRSDHFDLVPADLRNLQPRFLGKTDHLTWEDSQPRGAAIELLALLEQRLVADADSEEQPARSNEIAARLEQVLLLQRVQAIVERSDPWQHGGADILHLGRVSHEAHIRFQIAQRFVHAPEVAGTVIDQSNHPRSIRQSVEPFNGSTLRTLVLSSTATGHTRHRCRDPFPDAMWRSLFAFPKRRGRLPARVRSGAPRASHPPCCRESNSPWHSADGPVSPGVWSARGRRSRRRSECIPG